MLMFTTKQLSVVVAATAGLLLAAVGILSPVEAGADQASPTITITNEGASYVFSPDQLEAKVGQAITVTNNDPSGVHSVTAKDQSFSVDVPPKKTMTFTVAKAGAYPYYCQYHTDNHNAASITVS